MKNLKISTQLIIGFGTMLLFVVLLGAVAYWQSWQIHQQTETLYNHPLKVKSAVVELESEILNMRIGLGDLMTANADNEKQNALQLIALSEAEAHSQFDVIYNQYLGPHTDVDNAYKSFISWKTSQEEDAKLAIAGKIDQVQDNTSSKGITGIYRAQMNSQIQIIKNFAENKEATIFTNSIALHNTLNRQLILLTAVILLLAFIINFILLRNIRKPLIEMTDATKRFHNGDMNARSSYTSKNEFGMLSDSFNILSESIQVKTDLDEKFANLASLMLSEYDVKKFFQATLNTLAAHTGSQIAAIYLLSDDKKSFDHFESTGLDNNARQSFAADSFEGEFGAVLFSHKVNHLKNIPADTRFVFYTMSGKIIPREIITLPIIADNEIVAVISLASISNYSKQAIQLIDRIHITLCTRVEGILAYHRIRVILKEIELQNSELEAQKTELASQSAELIEQNTELEMQKNQLSEASQLKTNFLSNMSHELRTPLNSVIALSGVLNRRLADKIPEEEYSYLEVIERNGKHLLDLINDILDISRIEAGHEDIEITSFNANNLIKDVVRMIHPQAEQKNIELLHKDSDTLLNLFSDTDKCRHILQNLIGNAVKFTPKGSVEIAAFKNEKTMTITITDTGIGISEKHLPHIFDEFRQADGSTSRRFGGTGLGLTIAQKYAHLLGGNITVKSSLGKGSEFKLTLPLSYAVENEITDIVSSEKIKQTRNDLLYKPKPNEFVKTILLVEDSEPAIIQIKDFLEESGYTMLIARDGSEALEIINQTIPDAMILDLMMPVIDGFEVLKTLREAEPTAHIPVLILTAKQITKEELKFLKRNNIHQLIQKGDVNRSELLLAISTMVYPEPEYSKKVQPLVREPIGEKPLVLVVEDNPDNMLTAKALLADNYVVIEAVNGVEGVEMAKKYIPDLILMDIALSEISGIEAFKLIRNDTNLQHIPIIALTASAMTSDRETILKYGFDAYIAKPIDDIYFYKTINEVLYGK